MPEHLEKSRLFAIVRVDTFGLAEGTPSDVNWRNVVTVKGVVESLDHAVAETERLYSLNGSKGCVYLWQATRTLDYNLGEDAG
jgi:hypothetical protein